MDVNRAKEIIEALAEGIDPTTGELLPEDHVCNKGEVVRAFYTVFNELKTKRGGAKNIPSDYDVNLYEVLREVRKELSELEGRPAFMIFNNDTLQDMAAKAPTTKAQFIEVYGIGAYKAEQYSDPFIDAIKHYQQGH